MRKAVPICYTHFTVTKSPDMLREQLLTLDVDSLSNDLRLMESCINVVSSIRTKRVEQNCMTNVNALISSSHFVKKHAKTRGHLI